MILILKFRKILKFFRRKIARPLADFCAKIFAKKLRKNLAPACAISGRRPALPARRAGNDEDRPLAVFCAFGTYLSVKGSKSPCFRPSADFLSLPAIGRFSRLWRVFDHFRLEEPVLRILKDPLMDQRPFRALKKLNFKILKKLSKSFRKTF